MAKRLQIPASDRPLSGPNPPFTHYNYDALEGGQCKCFLCVDVEKQTEVVKKLEPLIPEDHDLNCLCDTCKNLRKERILLTAYAVRRDCLSELSYLVQNKKWRNEFLQWFIDTQLLVPNPQSYWSSTVDSLPLGHWIEKWAIATGRITDTKMSSNSRSPNDINTL